MAKEEIKIDGVDVSNCECFNPKYEGCHCYNTKEECYAINPNEHKSCKGVNCDYKQLKRQEQECEELKREIAFGNNGKLSDKIRAIVFKNLNDENSKYKQALDEIGNITDDYNRVEKTSQYYRDGFDEIQNVIDKVKEK